MSQYSKNIVSWFKLTFMSILLPGLAHFSMGDKNKAIIFPVLIIVGIAIVSWSGLLFLSFGGWLLLSWIGLAYFLGFYDCLKKSLLITDTNQSVPWWHSVLYLSVFIPIVIFLLLYKNIVFGFQLFQIPSQSMQPSLNPGDLVLTDTRWFSLTNLRVNDIVVFKRSSTDNTFYIKRIIATDVDEIEIAEGVLKVNGEVIKQNINPKQIVRRKIESNYYFVMGDNDKQSYDSRFWGDVKSENIAAKYIFTLYTNL